MAAGGCCRKQGYCHQKSPERDDVVKCLKNTRKGKLSYGSIGFAMEHSTSRRSVCVDSDRTLVVSLSSLPDIRNSESVIFVNENGKQGTENKLHVKKRIRSAKIPDELSVDLATPSLAIDQKTESVTKNEKDRISNESLCISDHDVLALLKDYKEELENNARAEMRAKRHDFLTGLNEIQHDRGGTERHISGKLYTKYISDVKELEATLQEAQTKNEEGMNNLLRNHRKRGNIVSKVNEVISRKQEEIDSEIRSQKEAQERKKSLCQSIESVISEIQELCRESLKQLNAHKNNAHLPDGIRALAEDLKAMFFNAAKIGKNAVKQQENLEEAAEFVQKTASNLKLTQHKILQEISKAEAKAKKEEERQELEKKAAEAKVLEEEKIAAERKKELEKNAATWNPGVTVVNKSPQSNALDLFVSPIALEKYQEILKFHEQVKASFAQFLSSADKKPLRFDLTKAVNTPINAISDQSPEHLLDKVERLTSLLNGDVIEMGSKRISASMDPSGLAYSKFTVAKKLVLQGARQISSNFNSAFAFGAVALGIWSKAPEVGKLIMANFYLSCPYLVPYYVPKKEGQSTAEYCKCLGYEVNGEDVESEDKYLKKLSGVIRLYASILQSPMPPSLSSIPHPHGMHNGWTWLTRIVNLEPRETVTATVLFDFLDVAGYSLSRNYGKQFWKLLCLICKELVPKIDRITQPDNKGPVVRLKIFLEKCVKSNSFPVPEGHLSVRWWKSKS